MTGCEGCKYEFVDFKNAPCASRCGIATKGGYRYMNNLKQIRKSRGLTQHALAAVAGVALRTIQDYESGRRRIDGASLETLCNLAIVLDAPLTDLLESSDLKAKLRSVTV